MAFPSGQCPSPQLHPRHRLFDPDGHQDGSPSSLQSRPCSLRLLAIPKAQGKPQRQSLFHNPGHEKGCDEGPKHAHTRRLPGGFPEVVGTVQQVH